jgi:hypothetical protein
MSFNLGKLGTNGPRTFIEDYSKNSLSKEFSNKLQNINNTSQAMSIVELAVDHAHGNVKKAVETLLQKYKMNAEQQSNVCTILTEINKNYQNKILRKIDFYATALRRALKEAIVLPNASQHKPLSKVTNAPSTQLDQRVVISWIKNLVEAVYNNDDFPLFYGIKPTNQQIEYLHVILKEIDMLATDNVPLDEEMKAEFVEKICHILNIPYVLQPKGNQDYLKVGR